MPFLHTGCFTSHLATISDLIQSIEMLNCVCDTHCHLGVKATVQDVERLVSFISSEESDQRPQSFSVMSTNHLDLALLEHLIKHDHTKAIMPYFGIHPWYSHLFTLDPTLSKEQHYTECLSPAPDDQLLSLLPHPITLDAHMARIRHIAEECHRNKIRYGIGEIGLDKSFRLPSNGFYGNQNVSEDIKLTKCKVSISHQLRVLQTQLALAHELQVSVSLHCVKAHGALFDLLKQNYDAISLVVLHSYSGSLEQARVWIRTFEKQSRKIAFSFSNIINAADNKVDTLEELVKSLSDAQTLAETDLPLDEYLVPGRLQEYYEHLRKVLSTISRANGRLVEEESEVLEDTTRVLNLIQNIA